ncbi:MAG: alpha/beta hydrolase [Patescibacteria group bacterium]|jgi:non-heme chloroperoxidase
MNYINVGKENSNNIDLYFEDRGLGKPVVLIHGFPLSGAAWEKEVAALIKAGYRTITYDRRGFGKSSQPKTGYDYDTFAADLNTLMTKLDLKDVVLVGHSMGTGEIARYLSAYGSKRVKKAVFIAPIPPFILKTENNSEGIDQSVFDAIMKSIKVNQLNYLAKFFSDFYNLDVNLDKLVSKEVVRSNMDIAAHASPTAILSCIPTWLTDFRKDLPKINIPALIIQGDADRILPLPITGKRLHEKINGSKLVVIKNGPHGIPWTHAEKINHELLNFLSKE